MEMVFSHKDTGGTPNLLEKFKTVINGFWFNTIIENRHPVILRYNK